MWRDVEGMWMQCVSNVEANVEEGKDAEKEENQKSRSWCLDGKESERESCVFLTSLGPNQVCICATESDNYTNNETSWRRLKSQTADELVVRQKERLKRGGITNLLQLWWSDAGEDNDFFSFFPKGDSLFCSVLFSVLISLFLFLLGEGRTSYAPRTFPALLFLSQLAFTDNNGEKVGVQEAQCKTKTYPSLLNTMANWQALFRCS